MQFVPKWQMFHDRDPLLCPSTPYLHIRFEQVKIREPNRAVEVHTRQGLDTEKIKELIWSKLGEMPDIDYHGTQYKFDHTLTLEVLKRISDLDYVLSVKASYIGPV